MTNPDVLSSDRPSTDPAQDLFGHAPFAKTLAAAIRNYRSSDGIVLALYGPWGSGKSTVLAYVQHELENGPELDRPVVVQFNPWWFSGQEHLAKAFLGQLQAVLPSKHEKFKKVGDLLAEFSGAIGGVAEFALAGLPVPFAGKLAETAVQRLASKPKDVPELKRSLAGALLDAKTRVLVVIDDIDRLAPDEVRQLFTVIKALADFPYVTYLLAFDREVAATAISAQTGLPGERYLEKIIQVPFELPMPDRFALRQALFKRLEAVVEPIPEGRFDQMHWTNIFHSGVDPLIKVPRDLVRLSNALSVTYPAVVGEVNVVDFIAIEALRVLLPGVYDAIRSSPEMFTGFTSPDSFDARESKEFALAFHESWLRVVPEPLQSSIKDMVKRLFPRLESVWDRMYYSGDSAEGWRRQLRICSPAVFPTYFRLSLTEGTVSRADVDVLLTSTQSSTSLARLLEDASLVKRPDGKSKASALLERFMDHVEEDVPLDHVQRTIEALFDVGDRLLKPADQDDNMFGAGNDARVGRAVYHLLKRVEPAKRVYLLIPVLEQAHALRCSQYLLIIFEREVEDAGKRGASSMFSAEDTLKLKGIWCERVKQLATQPDFVDHPTVGWLLSAWHAWGNSADAVAWWRAATASDEGLLKMITSQAHQSRSHSGSDLGFRTHLRVHPRGLEEFDDVQRLAARVQLLLDGNGVGEVHLPAAKQFVAACERIKAGVSTDA